MYHRTVEKVGLLIVVKQVRIRQIKTCNEIGLNFLQFQRVQFVIEGS